MTRRRRLLLAALLAAAASSCSRHDEAREAEGRWTRPGGASTARPAARGAARPAEAGVARPSVAPDAAAAPAPSGGTSDEVVPGESDAPVEAPAQASGAPVAVPPPRATAPPATPPPPVAAALAPARSAPPAAVRPERPAPSKASAAAPSSGDADTEPPVIQDIDIEPDHAPPGGTIALRITAKDDGSGLRTASGTLADPDGARFVSFSGAPDPRDPSVAIARVTLPSDAREGYWTVRALRVADAAGNETALTDPGGPLLRHAAVQVMRDAWIDAPVPERVILEPGRVVTPASHVRVLVQLASQGGAATRVEGSLSSPSGRMIPFGGTCDAATSRCEASFGVPAGAESGDWRVVSLVLWAGDRVVTLKSDAPVLAAPFLTVTSAQDDLAPPRLLRFEISTPVVTQGGVAGFRADVADDASGVAEVFGMLLPPGDGMPIAIQLRGREGVFIGEVHVPDEAPPGSWRVGFLELVDAAGNHARIEPADEMLQGVAMTVTAR